jgi:hypothetical protein
MAAYWLRADLLWARIHRLLGRTRSSPYIVNVISIRNTACGLSMAKLCSWLGPR